MNKKAKIHFRNKPFTACVVGKGASIRCTPVVYDEEFNFGVGIMFDEGGGQVWGLVSPRNLIAAWRGTEVLRHLDTIENGTLCAAYYSGVRDPHESEMKSYVQPTIDKIGRSTYEEIMSMPVPEQIVRAILDNQGEDFKPDLYPITDEVRAGTIQWRQEFADAGIKHPDDVDAKQREQEETIAKFERLLISYARSRSMPRECNGMWNVEGALLTLIEKGAHRTHSDRVIVALAGVVGELAVSEFAMTMLPFGPRNREEYDTQISRTKEQALNASSTWLASQSGFSRIFFWKRQKDPFTRGSVKELLRRLLGEYFPPKPADVNVSA